MDSDAPNIRSVRAGTGRSLVVAWKGGLESVVDISGHVDGYAVFAPIRSSEAAFRAVTVGEWGWCVHWSDEMEISSDTLWRLALEQDRAWIRSWRKVRGMTQGQAAAAVGISPRMWRYYEAGSHPLPRTVRLACLGFDSEAGAA